MPEKDLIWGVNEDGVVILGSNNHNYSNDDIVFDLLMKYKKVQFADKFNASIDFLPYGITHLHLGKKFNMPINNLPITLTHLSISPIAINYCKFNQSLDNLPLNLCSLTIELAFEFIYPIDNLPINLKHLYIGFSNTYNHPINNLPNGLEELTISHFDIENTHNLPKSLTKVKITSAIIKNAILDNYMSLLSNKFPNIEFEFGLV